MGPHIRSISLTEHADQNGTGNHGHKRVPAKGFFFLRYLKGHKKSGCSHDGCGCANGKMGGFIEMGIDKVSGSAGKQQHKRSHPKS